MPDEKRFREMIRALLGRLLRRPQSPPIDGQVSQKDNDVAVQHPSDEETAKKNTYPLW